MPTPLAGSLGMASADEASEMGASDLLGKQEGRRCSLLLTAIGLAAVAACAAVAALTAADVGVGDAGGEAAGQLQASIRATPRRASSNSNTTLPSEAMVDSGVHGPGCHTAQEGEPCHRHVNWAMQIGIWTNPEWYPGLTSASSFVEFQEVLYRADSFAECPRPCSTGPPPRAGTPAPRPPSTGRPTVAPPAAQPPSPPSTVPPTTAAPPTPPPPPTPTVAPPPSPPAGAPSVVGGQHWCAAPVPRDSLSLKDCSSGNGRQRVKVLTYNLFWWNLFGRRRGNGGSAGSLIRSATGSGPFDIMAFQEADNVWWPLRDAGMTKNEYDSESALGMAVVWRATAWRKLQAGVARIAEDRPDQWYGRRGVLWVRLQSVTTARTVLFANHHGPLPVGTGGICGGQATAYNILGLLQQHAQPADVVILTGDFNADSGSETFRTLLGRINHVFTGSSFGGVDHFFSNCAGNSVLEATNLGSGGSDHDALMVVFHV